MNTEKKPWKCTLSVAFETEEAEVTQCAELTFAEIPTSGQLFTALENSLEEMAKRTIDIAKNNFEVEDDDEELNEAEKK